MGDITEDVVLAHQQQSTKDETELCIGIWPADNDNMRGSKQEDGRDRGQVRISYWCGSTNDHCSKNIDCDKRRHGK